VRLSWFGEFFGALPDALRGLYEFGDPAGRGQGWWGIVILLIWGVLLTAVPLVIAKRTYGTRDWVSATMGVIAGLAIFWWVYGILPSAWIYYLASNKELLAGPIIPASAGITLGSGYRIDIASNLYDVIRDTVVVVEHLVAFVLTFWAAIKIQQRYPRTLVAGEVKPDAGGYK
jgi:hypothetical protein